MIPTTERMFRVALTADFFDEGGRVQFRDVGLSVLAAHANIAAVPMHGLHPCVTPEQLRGAQGAILMNPGVDRASVSQGRDLLALARFGVGYDDINVKACTEADVVFFTCAGAVDRSMAEATVGWMIALGHHYRMKDLLVRRGHWHETPRYMGVELRDRTLGTVGLGGIARATVELLRGFGMNRSIAFDPYADPAAAQRLGVDLVPLDDLMRRADFVSIHCPRNEKTLNLIGARELSLMKPAAFLINTARGGIVNEDALFGVLQAGRIAGAALDVFVGEPFDKPHRFGELDNVLLAPHAAGLTHELFRDLGHAACQGMVDLAQGRRPRSVINPEVFDRPGFQEKWERLRLTPGGATVQRPSSSSDVHEVPPAPPRPSPPPIRYTIAGLPDAVSQGYSFNIRCATGTLDVVSLAGTMGYVIVPNGRIDPQRRWVLLSPMYLGLDSKQQGEMPYRYYVEGLLAAGFHVAGVDIGTSCGSPAGVAVYQAFHEYVTRHYRLNKRARAIAQSNGGLRVYCWAFRHPGEVERVFGIFPALDMRDWPGLDRMFGPKSIIPAGMMYPLTQEELTARLPEFNPIDNLAPLAAAGVKIFHVHGDHDTLVRLEPNSIECGKRYTALGGQFELETVKGAAHEGTPAYYRCERGLQFLLED